MRFCNMGLCCLFSASSAGNLQLAMNLSPPPPTMVLKVLTVKNWVTQRIAPGQRPWYIMFTRPDSLFGTDWMDSDSNIRWCPPEWGKWISSLANTVLKASKVRVGWMENGKEMLRVSLLRFMDEPQKNSFSSSVHKSTECLVKVFLKRSHSSHKFTWRQEWDRRVIVRQKTVEKTTNRKRCCLAPLWKTLSVQSN